MPRSRSEFKVVQTCQKVLDHPLLLLQSVVRDNVRSFVAILAVYSCCHYSYSDYMAVITVLLSVIISAIIVS